jgi:hypothetical protein
VLFVSPETMYVRVAGPDVTDSRRHHKLTVAADSYTKANGETRLAAI